MGFLRRREREARLYGAPDPDVRVDAADPDRLRPEPGRAERDLVRQLPGRPRGGGKGVGGKGGLLGGGSAASADYTYSADLILALCEGPINDIGLIWKDLAIYSLAELGLGSYNGTTPQAAWPYLAAIYPYNALAYQGTAYVWSAGYNLGNAASIGNHNFEILGFLSGSGVNGIDADPAR